MIVLLLDESHLELVEDILKETNFNDLDWKQLRQVLGVHAEQQDENMLKEYLRRWLSSGATSNRFWIKPSTLDELAAALKRIGYSEAAEYIIKTCKLIIMFNDQCY